MTNYKQCETIISDILELKGFNVGDIVEEIHSKDRYFVLIDSQNKYMLWSEDYGEQWFPSSYLKYIQRNITLPMVLEAIRLKVVLKYYTIENLSIYKRNFNEIFSLEVLK